MDITDLVHPMSVPTFQRKVRDGECIVIEGDERKFSHLVSLEEIEARLNDGCNVAMPVHVIRDGERHPLVEEGVLWAPSATRKQEVLSLLEAGHSFMMTNMSQLNPRVAALIDSIEDFIVGAHADLHLYVSTRADASAYHIHRDRPQHKIYLQLVGATHWKIFRHRRDLPEDIGAFAEENPYLKLHLELDLQPGGLLYMPPNVFHKVTNAAGPRVSLSIPIIVQSNRPDIVRMDRTHIPFAKLFRESGGEGAAPPPPADSGPRERSSAAPLEGPPHSERLSHGPAEGFPPPPLAGDGQGS